MISFSARVNKKTGDIELVKRTFHGIERPDYDVEDTMTVACARGLAAQLIEACKEGEKIRKEIDGKLLTDLKKQRDNLQRRIADMEKA